MKLLVIPKEKNFFSDFVDGYILPLENYSVSYAEKYSLNEIRSYLQTGKDVFVIMNKNIFNSEIENIENTLLKLCDLQVSGVFFYDLSILSIVQRLKLNLPVVWNQTHMVTNYNTLNYYASKGVFGAVLSNEITLDEMVEIREKTDSKLFVNVVYRPVISFSRRKLIENYCKISNHKFQNSLHVHENMNGEDLLVNEERDGTSFFYGKIVNGLEIIPTLIQKNFDYVIVDLSNLIEKSENLCISTARGILDKKNVDISKVSEVIGNYTSFLYRKTIYKVKK